MKFSCGIARRASDSGRQGGKGSASQSMRGGNWLADGRREAKGAATRTLSTGPGFCRVRSVDDVSQRTFHVVQPRSGANLSDKTADGPLANPLGAREGAERGGAR